MNNQPLVRIEIDRTSAQFMFAVIENRLSEYNDALTACEKFENNLLKAANSLEMNAAYDIIENSDSVEQIQFNKNILQEIFIAIRRALNENLDAIRRLPNG
jgi:hypothetical protein